MKKNEIIKLDITDLNSDGAGVGRYDGLVVFVPYALPGETVEALIIKVTKSYAVGKIQNVIEKSEKRIEPLCPYFYRCGGCDYQHINYNEQLQLKCSSTIKNIQKISQKKDINIEKIIGADKIWNYRNKAQFPVSIDKQNNVIMGFFSPKSHRVVSIDECVLQDKKCNKIIEPIKRIIAKHNISVYDEINHKGILRHVIARASKNELMVILVTNSNKKLSENFVNDIKNNLPFVTTLIQNVNTKKGNIILGSECITLFGEGYINDSLCDINFRLRPLAFLQINPCQAEKLYSTALEYSGLLGDEIVFDAYCGIGVMSLMLAKKAKKLIGVEIVPEAIETAKESAKLNGINNAEFIVGACEDVLPQLLKKGENPDVIVVDPPRAGCEASLINAIAENQIKKIVYVSCNPATLARDIKLFNELGYSCSDVTFVDMFCHTKHIETVVLLSRKDVYERIKFDVNVEDLQGRASSTATYSEIKAYILEKYGLKVSSLYIAQIKDKCGFEKRDNYNIGEGKSKELICPPEKEQAIMDAFRHFGMLRD